MYSFRAVPSPARPRLSGKTSERFLCATGGPSSGRAARLASLLLQRDLLQMKLAVLVDVVASDVRGHRIEREREHRAEVEGLADDDVLHLAVQVLALGGVGAGAGILNGLIQLRADHSPGRVVKALRVEHLGDGEVRLRTPGPPLGERVSL